MAERLAGKILFAEAAIDGQKPEMLMFNRVTYGAVKLADAAGFLVELPEDIRQFDDHRKRILPKARKEFMSALDLRQRYNQAARQARDLGQKILLLTGSETQADSLDFFSLSESTKIEPLLSRFKILAVDVESDPLNATLLEAILGESIDRASTTLYVIGSDKRMLAKTTFHDLATSGKFLEKSLIRFVEQAANETADRALSIEDSSPFTELLRGTNP